MIFTFEDEYKIEGWGKCVGPCPPRDKRVYWRRASSGRGTIYLYLEEPTASRFKESDFAFGWIPEHIAQTIFLGNSRDGWCNYYRDSKTVVFCDYNSKGEGFHAGLSGTNFNSQRNRHWVTGDLIDNAPIKDIQMENVGYATEGVQSGYSPRQLGYKLGEQNKAAFFNAAYLEAGSLATKQLVKIAQKALPTMARGYADTALGKLLLANVAQMAVQYARPDNIQLVKLTEAMVSTAYLDMIRTVDLDSIIDQMLEGKGIKNALARAEQEDETST